MRGILLARTGKATPVRLKVSGRTVEAPRLKYAWVLEDRVGMALRRFRWQRHPLVLLTGEHYVPLRMPWDDPRKPTPALEGLLWERIEKLRQGMGKRRQTMTIVLLATQVVLVGLTLAVTMGAIALFAPALLQNFGLLGGGGG